MAEPGSPAKCCTCGRSIRPAEAYQRIEAGGEVCYFCCPLCVAAAEAGEVQRKMIPGSFTDERVDVLVEYLPALRIGGDYAYIRRSGEGRLHVLVADIAGHGITSSLVMSHVSAELDRLLAAGQEPAAVARELNRWMKSNLGDQRRYATIFHAVLDFARSTLTYVSCGHTNQFFWSRRQHALLRLESHTVPIGLFDAERFGTPPESRLPIAPGDKLILFTDGVPDLGKPESTTLGEEGLTRLLLADGGVPTLAAAHRLIRHLNAVGQESRTDDVLFVFVEIRAGAGKR